MTHEPNENQTENRPPQDGGTQAQERGSEDRKNNAPKIVSAARVAANKQNAQKSTGPKTAEGKARSRWNSIKHGLLARRLFTQNESDSDAFDHLLESLREDWQPNGTLEEILLERIAIGYYRLHVVYGYEAQYARTSRDFFATIDRTGRYATSINRQLTQDLYGARLDANDATELTVTIHGYRDIRRGKTAGTHTGPWPVGCDCGRRWVNDRASGVSGSQRHVP